MTSSPRQLLLPRPGGRDRAEGGERALVVGGGIAGVAAAVILAERGVAVTLIEAERFLGGRAGAWTEHLANGDAFEMERGFHAFFRQYYNLRALLRRIDPELGMLQPLDDYPILGPAGLAQSFAGLPRQTPRNIVALTLRTRALGFRDLLRVDRRQALEMLRFDLDATYERWDGRSAAQYLDALRFPIAARRLLFDVFSHSFFNPEADMSAAELLMMFHFYFTGNPEGLVFDVARRPFSRCIWEPFASFLERLGVRLLLGERARAVSRQENSWHVVTDRGAHRGDGLVLALTVTALQQLVDQSPTLGAAPWRRSIAGMKCTNPFAVWRLWLDGPTRPDRAPFAGTTGVGVLDNISLYHRFEDESRDWAARHGGAVVELHAYGVDPAADAEVLRRDMLRALHRLYPETAALRILEQRWLWRQDCPAFGTGAHATRPEVRTGTPGLCLAGDLVRLPFPSALMERAAASGFLAANCLLSEWGVRPEPILSVPARGMLARLPLRSPHTGSAPHEDRLQPSGTVS